MTPASCIFGRKESSFTAGPTLHVCGSCAQRVADLAVDPSETIWANHGSSGARAAAPSDVGEAVDTERVFEDFKRGVAKQISKDDAQAHLHLAEAYLEMGLYLDARRAAGVALAARSSRRTTDAALRLLLTPPLLPSGALDRLRERLRRVLH